jgi:hypothetical protein
MRIFWLLVLIVLVAGVYLHFNPEHKSRLHELVPDMDISKETARLYKWRNARGEWQITDHLPPVGIEYERLDYHKDQNVLPVPPQLLNRK